MVNQATISANPGSNTTPLLTQKVELIVKTPLSTEAENLNLVYAWNQSAGQMPEDEKFVVADLNGTTRTKTANVVSCDTEAGDYYLWAKLKVGTSEIIECFAPYAIKDHTTLVVCNKETAETSSFLGNSDIKRNEIEKVTIATSIGTHTTSESNCWDVSQSQDGKYLAWYEDTDEDGFYEVTIAGAGGVVANSDSSYLFSYIGYNGDDTQVIYGIENLDMGIANKCNAMFENCKNMKSINLKSFDTSNVTSMSYMFSKCDSLESLDLSTFNTKNVTTLEGTFQFCKSLKTVDLKGWDTSNVTLMGLGWYPISFGGMFDGCSSLTSLDISHFNTSKVKVMNRMFAGCNSLMSLDVSNFNTSQVASMGQMFAGCSQLTTLDVSGFDTRNTTNMANMFNGCSKLATLDVSKFNTAKARLEGMFSGCSNLTNIDVSNFDLSGVESLNGLSNMFNGCNKLTTLDVSNFNTAKVSNMGGMFNGCSSLTSLDVSNWDVTNLTSVSWMFASCTKLETLDTSNWKANWGTGNTWDVFSGCSSLKKLDLSGITTSYSAWIRGFFNRLQ